MGDRVDILELIVATLAAYRLSYLIAREEGPFGITSWLRGKIDSDQRTWIGRGLNCTLCISFWLALPAALIAGGGWLEWLGMAGAILFLHGMVVRNG